MLYECPKCEVPRELKKKPSEGQVCVTCKNKELTGKKVPDYYRTCISCGDVKKVNSKSGASKKYCSVCVRKAQQVTHIRTCKTCGKKETMSKKPSICSDRCKQCYGDEFREGKRKLRGKIKVIRYTYFCPSCHTPSIKKAKIRLKRCMHCLFTIKKLGSFDLITTKYVLDTPLKSKTVTKKKAAAKKTITAKTTAKKYKTDPNSRLSIRIELERKKNKEYREYAEKKEKPAPVQKLSDEDLVKQFLEKKKPSIVVSKKEEKEKIN